MQGFTVALVPSISSEAMSHTRDQVCIDVETKAPLSRRITVPPCAIFCAGAGRGVHIGGGDGGTNTPAACPCPLQAGRQCTGASSAPARPILEKTS